ACPVGGRLPWTCTWLVPLPPLMARAATLAPASFRTKVVAPPPPLRLRLCTDKLRLVTVIWLVPLPPLIMALDNDVCTLIVWPPAVTCEPDAVMALLPGAPLTVKLLLAEAWPSL